MIKTDTQKLEAVRKVIIEAVPEIMEPKRNTDIVIPQNNGEKYCYFIVSLTESNFYEDIPQTYKGNIIHEKQTLVALCRNKSICDDVLERFAIKDIEILGHSIRLSDVLIAVSKWAENQYGNLENYQVASSRELYVIERYCICDAWDLYQDDLNLQSPETISFLFDLLCKN